MTLQIATAPIWNSLYMRKLLFSFFINVACSVKQKDLFFIVHSSPVGETSGQRSGGGGG
jgi:hypothetical protein